MAALQAAELQRIGTEITLYGRQGTGPVELTELEEYTFDVGGASRTHHQPPPTLSPSGVIFKLSDPAQGGWCSGARSHPPRSPPWGGWATRHRS